MYFVISSCGNWYSRFDGRWALPHVPLRYVDRDNGASVSATFIAGNYGLTARRAFMSIDRILSATMESPIDSYKASRVVYGRMTWYRTMMSTLTSSYSGCSFNVARLRCSTTSDLHYRRAAASHLEPIEQQTLSAHRSTQCFDVWIRSDTTWLGH